MNNKKRNNNHILYMVYRIAIIICFLSFGRYTYASESFNTDILPYDFYELYGDRVVYNTEDNCITFVTKTSALKAGAATGYNRFGIRLLLEDSPYYIDLKTGDINNIPEPKYSTKQVCGDYFYYKIKIKLGYIIDLYSKAYPDVDFGVYFHKEKYTIYIDALMGIRKNNIYYCETDLKEDGKGRLASSSADKKGISAYHNLYTTAESLSDAYMLISGIRKDFNEWYKRNIIIYPNTPITDYSIEISELTIAGKYIYSPAKDRYYVKAGEEYRLSFYSQTIYNKKPSANLTYQPSENRLVHYNYYTGYPVPLTVTELFSTPHEAAGNKTYYRATNTPLHELITYNQSRSNDKSRLFTTIYTRIAEDSKSTIYYAGSTLYVNGKGVKYSGNSNIISITSDGIPPQIIADDLYIIDEKNPNIVIYGEDSGSGLKTVELYDESGKILLAKGDKYGISYNYIEKGTVSYIIIASDNVGNKSSKRISVKKKTTKPLIVGTH